MNTPLRAHRITGTQLVLVAIAGAAAVFAGCSRTGANGVVASGTDVELEAREVRTLLAQLPEETRESLRSDRATLERLVRAELVRRTLVAEAKAARHDADPQVDAQLERARDEALLQSWIEKQAQVADDYPSEDDLRLAYQKSIAALTAPTQYRVAQIFVAAPNGIEPSRLAAAMRKAAEVGGRIPGGDFASLAREYSEHAESAARGGDVGLLQSNQMLPEILAAVRGVEVGSAVGPVKTSQGLHYVKLLERQDPETPSFEASRERLRSALREQRAQELRQAYVAAISARLDVAVDQIALAQIAAPEPSPERQ